MMNPNLRLSASKIKALTDCARKFYCNFILMLPEKTHPRTICGSIVHSVLECCARPRHHKHYDMIMSGRKSVYNSPAVARLVRMWQDKHNLAQDIIDDVDDMVLVVFNHTNFFDEGATQTFPPEHEFNIKLPSGGAIKGFIDRFAIYGSESVITDYKSQKMRFTDEELKNNIQATMYQAYVMYTFGLPARVNFILLRHPPTKRDPQKHIQTVEPKTKEQIDGFFVYLEYLASIFGNFGLQESISNYCADKPEKAYFCQYICKFKEPMDYVAHIGTDGKIIRGYFMDDKMPELKEGESLEPRHYGGCPRFGGRL
jgi:CRISPR/Cas system-associated exonuclease Cas4 (RecB family)